MKKLRKCMWCGKFHIIPNDDVLCEMMPKAHDESLSNSERKKAIDLCIAEYDKVHCPFCGEKNTPEELSDDEITKWAYNLYDEFKMFINSEGAYMPQNIEIVLTNKIGGASCEYDDVLKMFAIEFNMYEPRIHRHNFAPMMYHEFTHLYDLYDPTTGGKRQNEGKFTYYHEYRAAAIQMMRMLKYHNLYQNKALSLSDEIIYDNMTFKVKDYFAYRAQKELKIFERTYKMLDIPGLLDIIRTIVYFIGELSMFRNHIDSKSFAMLELNICLIEDFIKHKLTYTNDEMDLLFNALKSFYVHGGNDTVDKTFRKNSAADYALYQAEGQLLYSIIEQLMMELIKANERKEI